MVIFAAVPSKRVRVVLVHANEAVSRDTISLPSLRPPATTVELTT